MQWSGGNIKWATIAREITEFFYIITWVLVMFAAIGSVESFHPD